MRRIVWTGALLLPMAAGAQGLVPMSLEQARSAAAQRYDALDTDHDGTLDVRELKGVVGRKRFPKADTDHDDKIDKAEWGAMVDRAFKHADVDGNGMVEASELAGPKGRALSNMMER